MELLYSVVGRTEEGRFVSVGREAQALTMPTWEARSHPSIDVYSCALKTC